MSFALPGEADRVERPRDARRRVAQAVQPGEELEVLGHRQAEVEAGALGHHRDPLSDLGSVAGLERNAGHLHRPRRRCDDRGQHPYGGRLAGAVGTEEAEHLARADAEGDIVDRDPVAEPFRQMLGQHDRLVETNTSLTPPGERPQGVSLALTEPARRRCTPSDAAGPDAAPVSSSLRPPVTSATIAYTANNKITSGTRTDDPRSNTSSATTAAPNATVSNQPCQLTGRHPTPTRRRRNHDAGTINPRLTPLRSHKILRLGRRQDADAHRLRPYHTARTDQAPGMNATPTQQCAATSSAEPATASPSSPSPNRTAVRARRLPMAPISSSRDRMARSGRARNRQSARSHTRCPSKTRNNPGRRLPSTAGSLAHRTLSSIA